MSEELSGDGLRRRRETAGWSIGEAARELKRRSSQPLPELVSLVRAWKRWEAGTRPNHLYRGLLAAVFEEPTAGAPPGSEASGRPARATVWRRWLAFELRRLREDAGLSVREAAQISRWATARLHAVENVQQAVVTDDVEKLLTLYRVPADRWGAYLHAAAQQDTGWWRSLDERVMPESLYLGLERGATLVRGYEMLVVPGLFQTPDYAAALHRSDVVPYTQAQVRGFVDARMARRTLLSRHPHPLQVWTVIDQAALQRMPGGPNVMAEQLVHLAEVADRPNVTLQVLPFDRVHGYGFGAFHILGFPWPSDPGVVCVEHRHGAVYLEETHEVDAHVLVFQHLCALALDPGRSAAMIRDLADRLRRRPAAARPVPVGYRQPVASSAPGP